MVTGEEDDEMLHSARCKLYTMVDGSWVERGTGVIKLNVTRDGGRSGARLGEPCPSHPLRTRFARELIALLPI